MQLKCSQTPEAVLTSHSISAIGAIGYPFYVGSLWYYDRGGSEAFPLFSQHPWLEHSVK